MRLDIFLKLSRLIHRRSLAQEFCDADKVLVNGAAAKSSKTVSVGDEITIIKPNATERFRVLEIPKTKQVSKGGSTALYEFIERVDRDPLDL
jgi:ribosomal 50S subunit-recycling heat shock protein